MSERRGVARYKQRWAAYLDILGYKNLVAEAQATRRITATIGLLREAIDAPLYLVASLRSSNLYRDVEIRLLSDSICITAAPTEAGGERIVTYVSGIAAWFAWKGIFLRGAVALGGHYDDGTLLFSPAMIEAHEIESTQAKFPRILLPEHLAMRILRDCDGRDTCRRSVWLDEDEKPFVNYLALLGDDALADTEPLQRHRKYIIRGMDRFREDPRVLPKYEWLAGYHNRFCGAALDDAEREGLLVELPQSTAEAER